MNTIDLPSLKENKIYPVDVERLKKVTVSYIDFSGNLHKDGEIVVLDIIEEEIKKIFEELLERQFPLFSIKDIKEFDYDDDMSMAANNSSAFNPRYISDINNNKLPSMHAYGLAVDINPKQNPFITIFSKDQALLGCHPKSSLNYLNRNNIRIGMVEPVVDIFKRNGLTIWGGEWDNPLDYHHFQTSKLVAHILANIDYNKGREFFEFYKSNYQLINKLDKENIYESNLQIEDYITYNVEKFLKNFYDNFVHIKESNLSEFIDKLLE